MKLILGQLIPGLAVIALCCVLFAIGGALVAVGLNWLVPGYYPGTLANVWGRSAASHASEEGVWQGSVLGLVVGLIVTLGLGQCRQFNLRSFGRAVWAIAMCGIVFAAGGSAIGYYLGKFEPAYYRSIFERSYREQFRDPQSPPFSPVDVGIGWGCSEGLIAGLLVGSVAAVGIAWLRTRRSRPTAPDFDQHPYDRPMPP